MIVKNEEDRIKFRQLKQNLDSTTDIVMMKYNVGFDEYNNITLSYYRERLSRRTNNFMWHDPVHEYLETNGKIVNSDICITHKKKNTSISDRNLSIYENIIFRGIDLSTRGLYYYARELYYHGRYDDAIVYFNKFLDTGAGWVEDKIKVVEGLEAELYTTMVATDAVDDAVVAVTSANEDEQEPKPLTAYAIGGALLIGGSLMTKRKFKLIK